jgi:RNA polymerase sigma factor (sigma-70 family)
MPDTQDMDLVQEFARHNSEAAFTKLVRRHIALVYSVARRCTGNDGDAQDVTQAVFIILARKAAGLRERTLLPGWLYETTRFTAARLLRTNARRQQREQEAYMQSTLNEADSADIWERLSPHLEDAMAKLAERDRALLVLRFYQDKSGPEAAALMGIREGAAHMRVTRAIEKLRKFFAQRGVTLSGEMIAGAISANFVQAAPVALAKAVTAVALAKGAVASATTLTLIKEALNIMAWTKAKTAIVASACVLLAAGTTTVTIYNMGKPMRSIQSEWSAISGDNGQWSWAGGKIEGHSVTGDSVFASSKKYGDVTLSAVVTTPNREATLAFRLQDATNGYSVVFAPGNTPGNDGPGFVRLNKIINANETRLGTYQGKKMVAAGKSAKIKVVAQGSLIEVYLNGANILRAHDTTFTSGYIGFRIYGWADAPCDATFSEVNFR